MMLRLASFAILLIGASAECLICLDGAQPGNMGTSIPELGGFTCGYAFYNSGALTANECTTVQLPQNQLLCGCAALVPAVSAAPVTATTSPETLAPAAETTAAPVTTVPAVETAAPVTSSPVAATGAPIAMTVAPSTAAPASVTAVPVTSAPADVGTVAPVTPAPVAGTSAPATSVPGTSVPATSAPATSAPGTSAPGTSAPGTSAPVTGTSAPVTNAPVGGTAAPVSGTVAPGTAPVAGTVAPGTVAPVTAAPVSETVTLAPVAPPSCTDLDRDPYEFFGNGSFISCCDPKQQCLADWNDNNRTYYRCVDNCTASPDIPEPEIPDVCTPSNADPYQVYGNGTIIPCCNPSKQCLNRWDGDDRNYYICINETERECPLQVTSFCSAQDVDPFEYFGTGEENECCTGLYKCLDNWDDDERYYYRCESCCENVVDDKCDGIDPSLLSPGKKGARSSEIGTLVAVPGEYGVYAAQKSGLTSGTGAMTSMVGILAGVLVCILVL